MVSTLWQTGWEEIVPRIVTEAQLIPENTKDAR